MRYHYDGFLLLEQRMHIRWIIVIAAMGTLYVAACKHGKCEDGGSSGAGRVSHNAGQNCFSCHHPDGPGEVCWNVSGTIYNSAGTLPVAGAQVRLFTAAHGGGNVALELSSDGSGNVYTSQEVRFGNGLFPAVINSAGDTSFMVEAVHDGACGRCHGSSTEHIKLP